MDGDPIGNDGVKGLILEGDIGGSEGRGGGRKNREKDYVGGGGGEEGRIREAWYMTGRSGRNFVINLWLLA
jgi:hypothetical protein